MAKKIMHRTAMSLICVLLLQGNSASAVNLLQAYQAALQNDPQQRSAKAESIAGKQYEVIGRAGLLPQVQYSYYTSQNKGESTAPTLLGLQTSDLDYRSSSKGVTVRQPLFNLDSYARFQQGLAQTKYSDAQFDARSKDLLVRVVSAYADAKYAEDQLTLYRAQRDSYLEQKLVNDRLFQKGEGTKTDMLETQAKLDVSEASVLEAIDGVQNARNALAGIIGIEVNELDSLKDDFNVANFLQGDFDYWKTIAEKNNPELAAAQYALEISEQEIAKSRAGHAPRVDLNASYNHARSETVATQKQDNNIRSLGVQLIIPIYTGGYVSAVSKQAVAQKEKAKAEFDGTHIKMVNELRKQFGSLKSSVAKIEALQKSVNSASLLVEATKQSIKGGVRINLDLLNAQQQLVVAKRDLAQARYTYLISFVKLKSTAGVVNYDDLKTVAGFFASN